jgi:hypothetical protein
MSLSEEGPAPYGVIAGKEYASLSDENPAGLDCTVTGVGALTHFNV